ncbi:MAG: biotin--[acetyl-CoA-carboxylase] ligase [Fimbriimonadaceae bacterium]|nr:biotin--[acetyl-CoA-carboxylase] ligase [Fimbriimonadaceae bacterium]
MWGKVVRYAEVTSTNDLARDHARRGATEGTVVLADWQAAGRGRLGRRWEAAAGQGLLASLILRPPAAAAHSAWLTLLAGVAVAETVREVTDLPAGLKWPNDVLLADRKLAGILTESSRLGDGHLAIVGIGLNVNQTSDDFPPELTTAATSLRLGSGREWDRRELLDDLTRRLPSLYRLLLDHDSEALRQRWLALDQTIGRSVTVEAADGPWQGRAAAIDDHGALWVEDAAGEPRRVLAGDVALRFDR